MNFKQFTEQLAGKQHKLDKNKNGKLDSHDFKLLRKEETEELQESHFKLGDKVECKDSGMKGVITKLDKEDGAEDEKYYTVKREDGKMVKYAPNELKAIKEGYAPVAPTLDKKYIKGTPENKAAKEASKPRTGHPTGSSVKEDLDEATPYYNKPSFIQRMSQAAKRERLERERKQSSQSGMSDKLRQGKTNNPSMKSMTKEEVELEEGMSNDDKSSIALKALVAKKNLKQAANKVKSVDFLKKMKDRVKAGEDLKKEEVEQIDEISAEVSKRVAQARDRSAVANKLTPTQSRRLGMGDKGGEPDMNAASALKSAMKRGAKDVYKEEVEELDELDQKTLSNFATRAKFSSDPKHREAAAKAQDKIIKKSKEMQKEEVELEEALRHEIAGAVGQFIGNKIDPVHGDIMRVHGKEAYRQAAYHIRKTVNDIKDAVSSLHDRLHKQLRTGGLATEEFELDETTHTNKKDDLPFTPDKPKKNPGVVPGKYGSGPSIAKSLAKQGMQKAMQKEDLDMSELTVEELLAIQEETLDELSKKTLGSYVNKAAVDLTHRVGDAERKKTLAMADYAHSISRGMSAKTADAHMKKDREAAKPDVKKAAQRMRGIEKAVGRLAKEEVEELEELSKSTLASYAKAATVDARMSQRTAKDFERHELKSRKPDYKAGAKEWKDKYQARAWKRQAGVHKAIDRLAKEEVELDEKMDMSKADMGDVIKDFQKSDAPQFVGKSSEKRRQMAIAAKLQADREVKSEGLASFGSYIAELDMNLIRAAQKSAKEKPTPRDPESDRNINKKYGYRNDHKDFDDESDDKPAPTGVKRGRGRPPGSKNR